MDSEKLRDKLLEYKQVTDTLIEVIKNESVENVDELFSARTELIGKINKLSFDSETFKAIGEELSLAEQDNLLRSLIQDKKKEIQTEIHNIKDKVNANRSYSANSLRKYNFINTKI